MKHDLLKLAERVEAATGPDRNLDAMIHFAIKNGVGCGMAQDAPHYTASLDAAMALVPEGWQVGGEMGSWHDDPQGICEAWVWPFESSYDPDWKMGQETQRSNPDGVTGNGSTLALALVSAALRALANGDSDD